MNELVHDAIVVGIADKYIREGNLEVNDFELQLLGRALNWAVPNLKYNFDDDLARVEQKEFKKRFDDDRDVIFKKGLDILNSDPLIEQLVLHYVAYEVHLATKIFPKDAEEKYPGIARMKKLLFQTTEKVPDIHHPDFKEDYKKMFVRFNSVYGKYGKVLKEETVDSLFSVL